MTIFSIPKEFVDEHISLIQNRAIQSWLPFGDVFLMGKDIGVAETAQKYGIKNIADIKHNDNGTPFVSSAFKKIQEITDDDIYMFANADIVFDESLKSTVEKLPKDRRFLAVGQRIDTSHLDTECPSGGKGALHSPAGIDYFIFPKGLFTDMPDLLVGRIGWDNWMIYHAKKSGCMVIDATESIKAYHQNHDCPNYNKGVERKTNPEALANIKVIGNKKNTMTIEDANWKMTKSGKLKRNYLHWLPGLKRKMKD